MSLEAISHTPSNEVRDWSNKEGIWQIITPAGDPNIIHRSIHFGKQIESYKNGVVVREKSETLYVYEVNLDFKTEKRQPTKEEAYSFFIHALLSETSYEPFVLKLQNYLSPH